MDDPIRVLICDDDAVVRRSLSAYVASAPDMQVVAAVSTCEQVQRALASNSVDVLLLDVWMPGTNGPELVQALADQLTGVKVIYLTSLLAQQLTDETVAGTVAGALTKDVTPDTLLNAIRIANGGVSVLSREPAASLEQPPTSTRMTVSLNAREHDVLTKLCAGHTNHEIGTALFLSDSTVKATVATLMERFQVTNRVSLALAAVDAGVI